MISCLPKLYEMYQNSNSAVYENNLLDNKTKLLISLAVSITLGDKDIVNTNLKKVKQVGIPNEVIGLIYALVTQTHIENINGIKNVNIQCDDFMSKEKKCCCS